jgi:hypothetical protein
VAPQVTQSAGDRRPAQRILVGVLSAGSIGFAALALARPEKIGRLVGGDAGIGRAFGVRDMAAGLALAAFPGSRGPVIARMAFDLSDGILFGRKNPKVAAMAFGFAAVGAAALLSR